MRWNELPAESRALVLDALRQEAARHEGEAAHGQIAAQTLGRPSLLDGPLRALLAFGAAIELLEAEAKK